MTPQELKNSILQLAIQGKLVEQRPEEGTGEELYRQIQSEQQRLIKSGKIKKKKALPEITPDEIPFDIPEKWKWVRLNSISNIEAGGTPERHNPNYWNGEIPWVKIGDISSKYVTQTSEKITKAGLDNSSAKVFPAGTLLYTIFATIGTVGILKIDAATNQAIAGITAYTGIYLEYLYLVALGLKSILVAQAHGMAQLNINQTILKQAPIPLPPFAEQKRIVAKIEELLPYIDRYEKAWSKLEDFNKRFPGDLQKSLLQMAIQGKLVDHRPEEGTGEELYRQIQFEKQRFIKSGKIKKENPLPEITPDEIPFDIPESWKWVRIGKIFNLQAGKTISSAEIYQEASPEHVYRCYGGNGCRGYVAGYNRSGHFALIGRQGALCGNINYAEGDFYATEHAVVVEQFGGTSVAWCGYFLKALNLNQYATATAQPGLAVTNINQVLIPLPPLAEQKRIVAKLEELLPLCERLK